MKGQHIKKQLTAKSRWEVIFQDNESWRVGLYLPEYSSTEDITTLEKHTCPELFVCQGGKAGLLTRDDEGNEEVHILQPGEALFVEDYHNGFSVEEGGSFLVVEQPHFQTTHIDRKTGEVVQIITV